MVMIIQNPAASTVDTTGQGIGQSLNSIASAFASRQADINGQIAFQKYQDQQTAQKVLAGVGANVADANQDYAQDQPDYAQAVLPRARRNRSRLLTSTTRIGSAVHS
jgi:hypothetical protein